jgi:RNA polymerase sigma factor (sigma-70 family)
MNRATEVSPELIQFMAEMMETAAWQGSASVLAGFEPHVPAWLELMGLTVEQVLAEVSDEGLVLAMQKRFLWGQTLLELFHNRYEERLRRWFFRWGARADQLSDFVHDLFVKFFTNACRDYQPTGNFRSYLWTSAYHLWLESLRKKKPKSSSTLPEPTANGAGPVESLLEAEMNDLYDKAIQTLPPVQQQVLRRTMAGQTAGKIAGKMALEVTAVYRALFKARRAVEEAVRKTGG